MSSLRSKIIRLSKEHPEYQDALLPLLRKAATSQFATLDGWEGGVVVKLRHAVETSGSGVGADYFKKQIDQTEKVFGSYVQYVKGKLNKPQQRKPSFFVRAIPQSQRMVEIVGYVSITAEDVSEDLLQSIAHGGQQLKARVRWGKDAKLGWPETGSGAWR